MKSTHLRKKKKQFFFFFAKQQKRNYLYLPMWMLMISRMLASSSPGSRFGIPEKPSCWWSCTCACLRSGVADAAIQRWRDGALQRPRVAALQRPRVAALQRPRDTGPRWNHWVVPSTGTPVCTTPGAGWYPPVLNGPGVANYSSILFYFIFTKK
jgi:hypothetical protein